MRAIKFRAWDKQQKKMREVNALHLDVQIGMTRSDRAILADLYEMSRTYHVGRDVELMQFTGLVDKNGKEIYEGDIVLHHDHDLTFIVKWCDGIKENLGAQVGWTLNNGYYTVEFVANQKYPSEHDDDYLDATILGNIYEHPELLADMGSFGYDPITGEQTDHEEKQ